MRLSLLSIFALLWVLSACSFGKSPPPEAPGPYPSVPMDGTIGLEKNISLTGGSYKATGTEPFWSVEVVPGKATLSRPGEKEVVTTSFQTTEDNKGAFITIKGIKGDFFLNLIKGECTDGMSETKYTHKATLLVGSDTLFGCAVSR